MLSLKIFSIRTFALLFLRHEHAQEWLTRGLLHYNSYGAFTGVDCKLPIGGTSPCPYGFPERKCKLFNRPHLGNEKKLLPTRKFCAYLEGGSNFTKRKEKCYFLIQSSDICNL